MRSRSLAYALRLAATLTVIISGLTRHGARHQGEDSLVLIAAEPDDALDADAVASINDAIATLPLAQREVVVLKIWDNRTFAEIAEILDLSHNTAASRYRYATSKLREILGGLIDA